MKKTLALVLALCMALALAACGGGGTAEESVSPSQAPSPSASEPEPSAEPEPASSVPAGTYMYYEDKGNMGATPWTLELNADGSCTITEANSFIGDQVHTCTWTDNGDKTFETGPWDGGVDGPMSDFFREDGSATWSLDDGGTVSPADGVPSLSQADYEAIAASTDTSAFDDAPPAGGPEDGGASPAGGAVSAGTYTYEEDKGDMGVTPWIVELGEDGTCTITEKNEHIGDQVHTCAWTDNGDGTFTTGAWDGGADGPKSEFFGEDGSATWRTAGPDQCEPVT